MFFESAFQASAGFSNIRRITVFLRAGPLINHILTQLCWDFVFRVHEQGFKVVHPLRLF